VIWRAASRAITLVSGLALLLTFVAGCNLIRAQKGAGQVLTAPAESPSLLVLILGSSSAQAHDAFNAAVVSAARTGEHIIVLSAAGSTLGEFGAPKPPAMRGPAVPVRPGADATSFELAKYRKSSTVASAAVVRDLQTLQLRERHDVQAWANHVAAQAWSAAQRSAVRAPSLTRSLANAVADVTALEQAGGEFGPRLVLGLIDLPDPDSPPARLDASLAGLTVVLTGIPDSLADASWQAALLESGAARAYVLPVAPASLLSGLISAGLTKQIGLRFVLTGLDYGPGQFAVPSRALPSLRRLLRLLTITYRSATATVNAYTDAVPVRGGNLLLSWRRAKAVLAWLVDHGVAAYRLQAIGHGSADPVAPNKATGQPLNRRVVVIVAADG
jgi:outer membrane protein OmpA-like peptidoglycan-associated protein